MGTKIEIKKAKVDFFEMEELACKILGLDYDEIDADTNVIEEAMYEQLEMSLEMFLLYFLPQELNMTPTM